ncbi:retrovirus-related pol polyprotein from transposon TNT 1-94 [Tanacetum coccineum]
MAKASPTQAWLWHRRLSHLNFDYINLLSKKDVVIGLPKLKYVASINGKKYILDETPKVLKDFLKMIQQNLQALIIYVRTDRGTEFLNKTLHAYFKEEGIEHQTSTPRTPKQNGIVERQNHTLVEATRMMLSASKLPLFFWAEASFSNDKTLDYDNSGPAPQLQNVSPSTDTTVASQQELDLLFGPLYDEFFNVGTLSVNKSSSPIDNSKQQDTSPTTNIQPSTEPTTPTNVNAEEYNDNQAADTQVQQDEFINPFCTPVQEIFKSSSRNIDNSNMHTFYQPYDSEYR